MAKRIERSDARVREPGNGEAAQLRTGRQATRRHARQGYEQAEKYEKGNYRELSRQALDVVLTTDKGMIRKLIIA